MRKTKNIFSTHQCIIKDINKRRLSFIYKLKSFYLSRVKSLQNYLDKGGERWHITSCIVAALLSEPATNIYLGLRPYISGWKNVWEKYGFFDAGDTLSLEALRTVLKASDHLEPPPVILLHGLATSPDIWIPWATMLKDARAAKKIGHVIALQMPNDMEDRMDLVYKAIEDVAKIYEEASLEGVVDLVGHSQGGYAAHLAAFERILEVERDFLLERCHDPNSRKLRNKKVRKLISLGAPKRIFPQFSMEDHFSNFFLNNHDNIFDIVGIEDVICPTLSHLEDKQVFAVQHGHLGMITCSRVCQLVIEILSDDRENLNRWA